jgi:hypothetical protein
VFRSTADSRAALRSRITGRFEELIAPGKKILKGKPRILAQTDRQLFS